ncbi:adenylate/guanylate cyclase domain-containing protein [Mycobacterium yunnanensis]|uniref:Adenylate/guanylate cyclase domain-containing protein n=1 Tax=Mycobacterium yunnanensis TaxID=368477 RepID=A0A9X2YWL0_9MYCO|nr:adenylate/guanylate cyclase domain-containing protein [Mycobacterium yunnanensis]MCV7419868.1 adenylate/guanylate cyclase domain-containing protein [Mycobacterium yunnanensis]
MDDLDDLDAAGLLDGLEGTARIERAELVEWLTARGYTADQIRESFAPMLLATRAAIGDDGTLVSARQISEASGLDLQLLERLMRAVGLPRVDDPDAAVLPKSDGNAFASARHFLELGISEDQVVLVLQVLAEGLTRAAEVMRYAALAAVLKPGATELETAKASEVLVQQVAPLLGPMMEDTLRLQLLHVMENEAVTNTERAEGVPLPGARLVTIAFADLVGFTRLGEAVPPEELEALAHRLVDLAREVAQPPVRYVKSIGDEVMLVSSDPVAMIRAALDLLEATEADEDFPRLRVGLATGMAVSRAGDWYGNSVNLASRVTGAARPSAVLVSESTREAVGDVEEFSWSFAGARHLKNIKDEVKLFRVRRATARE